MSTETLAAIAVALGAGWASGLNTYAAILVLGAAQRLGVVGLPHDLQVLASPWVMAVAALLFALNFFADKIPYVDSINDMLQTFVRIPGGALLAAAAVADHSAALALAAALLGGTFAAGAHFTKAGSRVLINTSPEPFSNWAASLTEDALAAGMVWFVFKYPLALLVIIILLVALTAWLLPKLWRGVRGALAATRRIFATAG